MRNLARLWRDSGDAALPAAVAAALGLPPEQGEALLRQALDEAGEPGPVAQ